MEFLRLRARGPPAGRGRRGILAKHEMEVVGEQLRSQMLWKNDNNLDNASN